jgi:hypothetical protein
MLHYKKVLFIHIPKNAGASVRHFLNQHKLESWKRAHVFTLHDPFFILEKNNDLSDAYKFAIVRNPYTRAFSHYKHIQLIKKYNNSFTDFLNLIRINGQIWLSGIQHEDQINFNRSFPLISFRQSFYLYDTNGNISIDKIYRKENLIEFETDFDTKLQQLNKNSYTQEEYLEAYNSTNKNLVKNLFIEDFINFNYSLHFEDSIN